MIKKTILFIIFTLFIGGVANAQNDSWTFQQFHEQHHKTFSDLHNQAMQQRDFRSARAWSQEVLKNLLLALCDQSMPIEERNKYSRRVIEFLIESFMVEMYANSPYDSAKIFLVWIHDLLSKKGLYRQKEIEKCGSLITKYRNHSLSLHDHKKLLNKCLNIILSPNLEFRMYPRGPINVAPPTPNYVVPQIPNFSTQTPIRVPSGGGYSVPSVNYRRTCSRPGHGSYDIRFGGCPACKAPVFGL